MAVNEEVKKAVDAIYEARDYAMRSRLLEELSEFLLNFLDGGLDDVEVGDIDTAIHARMDMVIAEFCGYLLVGACNRGHLEKNRAMQARFFDMFESGMLGDVILRLNPLDAKEPEGDNFEPFADKIVACDEEGENFTQAHADVFSQMRQLVIDAPATGPEEFMNLMAGVERILDEIKGRYGMMG
jgi:hypothetical protein